MPKLCSVVHYIVSAYPDDIVALLFICLAIRFRVAALSRYKSDSFDLHKDNSHIHEGSLNHNPISMRSAVTSSHQSLTCAEEHFTNMQNTHKWISMPTLHCPRCHSHKVRQTENSLQVEMESPPLVLYGPATTSSGALFSGQLILQITSETMAIESLDMSLGISVMRKKYFHTHLVESGRQNSTLESWQFLHGRTELPKGQYKYPFSWILPGNLPASTKGTLINIEYKLHAILTLKGAEALTLSKILEVKRAIIPSDRPRNSIRIFPPTNLTAHCGLPSVIHPFGTSTVFIRINGCVIKNNETKIIHQWKLKRVHWYLEETQKIYSTAHRKGHTKRCNGTEESNEVTHTDIRIVGEDSYRMGWKSEFSMSSGTIEMEFPCAIRPGVKPLCDVKTKDGDEVSHSLVVEMLVAEEVASMTRMPFECVSTGAARVLRMHFNVIVTERSGLGISWDEEQPPLYEHVPASPPEYRYSVPCKEEGANGYEHILRTASQRAGQSAIKLQNFMIRSPGRYNKILF